MKRTALAVGGGVWVACVLACGGAASETRQSTNGDGTSSQEQPKTQGVQERWESRLKVERASRMKQLKGELEEAEEGITDANKAYKKAVDGGLGFSKQQEKKKEIDVAIQKRDKVKDGIANVGEWEPQDMPDKFKEGMVGKFGTGTGRTPVFEIVQVIDSTHAILEFDDRLYWFEMPTRGLVDGKTITVEKLIECTGTKRYTTAIGGSNTVPEFKVH